MEIGCMLMLICIKNSFHFVSNGWEMLPRDFWFAKLYDFAS